MKIKNILLLFLLATSFLACQTDPSEEIAANQLKEKIDSENELVIIDVAEPDEHRSARIEGSLNIPIMGLKDNFEDKLPEVEKDEEIILYCYSGARSALGVNKLKELGYTNVKTLVGGISNWEREGYPVKSGN